MSEFVVGSKGIEGPCRLYKTKNICRQLVIFSSFLKNWNFIRILLHFSNYASLDLDDIRRRRKDNLPTHVSNFLKRRNKRDTSWYNPCEEHYHLNPKCYTVLQKASFNCHNNSKFQGSEFYRKYLWTWTEVCFSRWPKSKGKDTSKSYVLIINSYFSQILSPKS